DHDRDFDRDDRRRRNRDRDFDRDDRRDW
ncbi:hypothetical protein IIM_04968, partial [Bacillus cereus VD107]